MKGLPFINFGLKPKDSEQQEQPAIVMGENSGECRNLSAGRSAFTGDWDRQQAQQGSGGYPRTG